MQTVTLSSNAVAVLRFEIRGWRAKDTATRLPAYRELAAAGIMEPAPGSDVEYCFTREGLEHGEAILQREADRIERTRYELPKASGLSEAARDLLHRRLAGDQEVTDANRPLYRELVAARIMYPVSTWAGGPESVFRFTSEGWERREEWINAGADARRP